MKKVILTQFLVVLALLPLAAAEQKVTVDSVKIEENVLTVDFTAVGMINDKTAEGLQKGLTTSIEYQVQLWEKKGGWINNLIANQSVRMKVFFDNWEKKYVVISFAEKRITRSLETVREQCSHIHSLPVALFEELPQNKQLFITVKAILRPMSVENYQDIKNWLSGQTKNLEIEKLGDTEKQEKKIKGGLLKIFLALTGFGDRTVSGKSTLFRISQSGIDWVE
ncbi:MAG TPA: DUF4390 domain-containing protein [bacterium]|nr:DUF4390 domain-containing protein [bacterium]